MFCHHFYKLLKSLFFFREHKLSNFINARRNEVQLCMTQIALNEPENPIFILSFLFEHNVLVHNFLPVSNPEKVNSQKETHW